MSAHSKGLLSTSIFRKQVVAITGIFLVLFIVGHLAGNLLIFVGPDALNTYAEKLRGLGPLLWVMRVALLAAFVIHIYMTIKLTQENRAAGAGRYAVSKPKGDWDLSARTMMLTGLLVFFFFFFHLADFTFTEHEGEASVVVTAEGDEKNLGLYGLVWNAFLDPWRSAFYVVAVIGVGMHLTHGIQSLFQSLGITHSRYTPWIHGISVLVGVVVAVGFALIPIYVLIRHHTIGVGV
ncbi:MAG: succinate dehydrogenase cytochrome b subunit [Candidatus Hydrogenedentota bacterium]